jgi:hypothetical protein
MRFNRPITPEYLAAVTEIGLLRALPGLGDHCMYGIDVDVEKITERSLRQVGLTSRAI